MPDDLGVYGLMYVEKVEFVGTENSTHTWLTLFRLGDIFFHEEVESTKKVPKRKKLEPKGINASVFHPGVYVFKTEGIESDQDNSFPATFLEPFNEPFEGPVDIRNTFDDAEYWERRYGVGTPASVEADADPMEGNSALSEDDPLAENEIGFGPGDNEP